MLRTKSQRLGHGGRGRSKVSTWEQPGLAIDTEISKSRLQQPQQEREPPGHS